MKFNEVLVWFMDGLEIKEGSIKVMVFPSRSSWVHEAHGGSMRIIEVQEGQAQSKSFKEVQ